MSIELRVTVTMAIVAVCVGLTTRVDGGKWRLLLLLSMLSLILAVWATPRAEKTAYRIGTTAIVYDRLADRYVERAEPIRVVDTSLEDGRGVVLTHRSDTLITLLVSDVWEAALEYEWDRATGAVAAGSPRRQPEEQAICPGGECEAAEHGGFVTNGVSDEIVFCESHARRVLAWKVIPAGGTTDTRDEKSKITTEVPGIPLDAVAVAKSTVAIALSGDDTPPREGQAPKPGSVAIYRVGQREPVVVEKNVTRPVGLAFSQAKNAQAKDRLYVADVSSGQLVWEYFEYTDGRFGPASVIWAVRLPPPAWPRLHHMVTASDGESEAVFAGGPDGLYIFGRDGGLLAKYYVGAGVSGLTWAAPDQLFMTIGRRLAVLRTKSVAPKLEFSLLPDDASSPPVPDARSPKR
jgi:hypothetical protein